jgi:beta-galactosidase
LKEQQDALPAVSNKNSLTESTPMNMSSFAFPRLYHGADYNPEQWPEAVWDDDVRLMQLAHVNIATLPVFGWVHLEPEEGVYTFEWLDRILDKLHDGGVGLCLATATASVPAWMDRKYPDILRVDKDGRRLSHGNRHSFCPNSSSFRRLSTALAGKLAERYAGHPGLLVWHVGNEYAATCYCEQCAAAFRDWLKERYTSLSSLNERWYTAFWGHTYTDWAQIEPPISTGERSIPALLIDYDRFQSQSILNCFVAERDAIRAYSSDVPITTNLMGACKPTNYRKWAAEMDIISWDSYPAWGASPAEIAFSHSLMRGLKEGQPWMLMEQTPSQQNWQAYNSLKRPGVARLWSYQAMAHGADAIMYFQWRRGRGGFEKLHGAIVEHAGRADARVFQEVAALGAELEALGTTTLGGRVQSEVALLFDWENWWAVDYCSGPGIDMKYLPQVQRFYQALHEAGYVSDVVAFDADLSRYKLVVAPVLYLLKPGEAERLRAFVENGGTLVVSYFSGIADETDLVFTGGYPGPLRDILGVWVEEIDALPPTEHNEIQFAGGIQSGMLAACSLFFERVHPEGETQVVATYTRDFYAGEPAVTVNRFGDGRSYYLATVIEADGLRKLLGAVAAESGASLPLPGVMPKNVEVTLRTSPSGHRLIYVLNHTSAAVTIPLGNRSYYDHLSGKNAQTELTLGAYGVAILAENSPS